MGIGAEEVPSPPLLVQAGMVEEGAVQVPGDVAAEASSANITSGDKGRSVSRKSLKGGVGKKLSTFPPPRVVGTRFSAAGASDT